MKLKITLSTFGFLFLCGLIVFGGQAYALPISPGSDSLILNGLSEPYYSDNVNYPGHNQSTINDILDDFFAPDPVVNLYENSVDDGETLEGLWASYETSFTPTTEPDGAIITWIGPQIITDAYLLVKDGNHEPFWYLFDLTAAGWNGMEDLVLSGFWTGEENGAISHISLYGTAAPVPEPATMLLLGTGLVGLAGLGRRKFIKN